MKRRSLFLFELGSGFCFSRDVALRSLFLIIGWFNTPVFTNLAIAKSEAILLGHYGPEPQEHWAHDIRSGAPANTKWFNQMTVARKLNRKTNSAIGERI